MNFKKLFNILLSFYLLFVNSLTLTHYHEDNHPHPDCQICVLQLNQQSQDPNDLGLDFEIVKYQESHKVLSTQVYISKIIPINTLPRSPPLYL
ncbi:hypothetical protein SULAZ_0930 [Sulfurihydrogenibium azorense Az-Fu1]|uniref:Uncharacterized protein n=1 Tax=Sulfurihydrogenibium azorense (strain DSM 15241 / OCM 825 / Az-Fu1) TaxID=204536 RepID=C1DUW6_SULAA|nr:hypothetical protein [Sulfurihydrogenibium azorense]ACN99417.1 hypothetical protein SULAZ_0930 [Sulfurihydrogenibium azorense Az-Fu1]